MSMATINANGRLADAALRNARPVAGYSAGTLPMGLTTGW